MRCVFITMFIAMGLGIALRGKPEPVHACDTIVVPVYVTDTITEYICLNGHGSFYCGFDPVKAALMAQAD